MDFVVSNQPDLDQVTARFGVTAPPRLHRRGRQTELDAWCLNRLLRAPTFVFGIGFPFSFEQRERPDFAFHTNGCCFGVEVTEAVIHDEQQSLTQAIKDDERAVGGGRAGFDTIFRDPGEQRATEIVVELFQEALRNKSKAILDYETDKNHILVYVNTRYSIYANEDIFRDYVLSKENQFHGDVLGVWAIFRGQIIGRFFH